MSLNNLKFRAFIYTIIVTAIVYLVFSYGMPLIIPFLLGYAIAHFMNPMINWLHSRVRINKIISTILILASIIFIFFVSAGLLIKQFLAQLKTLINNADFIISILYSKLESICGWCANTFGLDQVQFMKMADEKLNIFAQVSEDKIVQGVMGNSIPILQGVIEVIIAGFIIIISAYLFSRYRDRIVEWRKNFIFKKEMDMVVGKLRIVLTAFVKTQAIIFIATAVVCVIGLWIIGNKYSIILGIVIGILDALPFIGTGIVLIPWAIISFASGRIFEGVSLICIFILTYLIREILEPKLMGNNIGISPLASLISIYIGYKIFGLLGLLYGPIAYVIIENMVKELIIETYKDKEKQKDS